MRKRRKLNTLFDLDDVEALSKKAEISADKALTADERRIEIGKRLLAAAKDSTAHASDDDSDLDDDERKSARDAAIHETLMSRIGQLEGKQRVRMAKPLKDYLSKHKSLHLQLKSLRGHRLS